MKPIEPPMPSLEPSANDREIELKLGLTKAAADKLRGMPLLRERAIAPPETARLETIYVDTPSLDLFRAGVFLRVRRKGDGYVQALKTRGAMLSGIEDRRETEVALPDAAVRPDLVVDPPAVLRRKKVRKRLSPMVATHITRTTWLLDDVTGARIELALDQGRIEANGRSLPISEIELELRRGAPGALFELALALLDGVPLRAGEASKAVRGFRLIQPEPPAPVKATIARLDPLQTVDDAFQVIARSCLAQALSNLPAVVHGADPEGVHQMRVGVRRLRSAMSLFCKVLGGAETDAVARDLKWLLGRLGPARDIDVFLSDIFAPVGAHFADDPACAVLESLAEQRRAEEYRRVRALMKSPRFTRLALGIGRWIENRGWHDESDQRARRLRDGSVTAFASAALAKRHARLKAVGRRIEILSSDDLHRLRIQVKKQRYAVEFFQSLYAARRATRYLDGLRELQGSLGYLNDAAVAERLLADLTAGLSRSGARARDARAAGAILIGWHGCEVASHRPLLFESWRRFGKRRTFWK